MKVDFDELLASLSKISHLFDTDDIIMLRRLDSLIASLDEKALEEILKVYQSMKKVSYPGMQSEIFEMSRRHKKYAPIWRFLAIVGRLSELGYISFSDYHEVFQDAPYAWDWSALQNDFPYLVEPAKRYGIPRTELSILDAIETADDRIRTDMEELAAQIRYRNDWEKILTWVNENDKQYPKECHRVYMLLLTLDHMDLSS